jgi:alcohol dehydrogenase (cytochrome c)
MRALIGVLLFVALMTAQQRLPAGPFTAQQQNAGRTVYQTNCASCHMPDLGGRNEAPPLAGSNFMTTWGPRSTRALFTTTQTTMPPARGNSLSAEEYASVTAFILASNGATAGAQPLGPATDVVIRTIASGQAQPATAALTAPLTGQPARPASPRGVTVAGEVKNYVRVTDDMLRNPDPGDWLMIRRNYQAWNHSPLTQITRDNVKNLQLAWVWPMNEGGTSQPAPIAHNGTVYLNSPGNIVQALDGRTGELVWEHRLGPDTGGLGTYGAMRGMAIYDARLFWPPVMLALSPSARATENSSGKPRSPIVRKVMSKPAVRSSFAVR